MAEPAPFVFAIRAEYAQRILDGSKRWEFRKRMPRVSMGDTALIYESRGRGRVVASFRVGSLVHSMPPGSLWRTIEVMDPGSHGIEREAFMRYFGGRSGIAIGVENVRTLDLPLPSCMRPPQSWARWRGPWPLEATTAPISIPVTIEVTPRVTPKVLRSLRTLNKAHGWDPYDGSEPPEACKQAHARLRQIIRVEAVGTVELDGTVRVAVDV